LIVQAPAVTGVTLVPLTVQTLVVVEVKVTGRPELAVAVIETGEPGNVMLPTGPNVIV
jgi:hypothetical protein